MLRKKWASNLVTLLQQRNTYLVVMLGLLVLAILQGLIIFSLSHSWHIIVTPPTISKSFWVDESHVSDAYLSEMTVFFAYLLLNITPENAAYQREEILKYTDPKSYGVLKAQLVANEDKIKTENITTAFYPVDIKTNAKRLSATIAGNLVSSVSQQVVSTVRQSYLVQYSYHEGRLLIQKFKEINANAN